MTPLPKDKKYTIIYTPREMALHISLAILFGVLLGTAPLFLYLYFHNSTK